MSADLLAEFDSFYAKSGAANDKQVNSDHDEPAKSHSNERTAPAADISWAQEDTANPWQRAELHAANQITSLSVDVEDDWGEFETGQSPEANAKQEDSHGAVAGERDARQGAEKNTELKAPPNLSADYQIHRKREPKRPSRDDSVLFDVDDELEYEEDSGEAEEEDFGDFETAKRAPQKPDDVQYSTNKESLIDFVDAEDHQWGETTRSKSQPQSRFEIQPSIDPFGDIEGSQSAPKKSKYFVQTPGMNYEHKNTRFLQEFQTADNQLPEVDWGWDEKGFAREETITSSKEPQLYEPTAKTATDLSLDAAGSTLTREAPKSVPVELPGTDDPWDDFEEGAVEEDTTLSKNIMESMNQPQSSGNVSRNEGQVLDKSATDGLELTLPNLLYREGPKAPQAPINVPPPALLLPLFPPIIKTVREKLYDSVARHEEASALRNGILARERTKEFLMSYLDIATVLSHVIAGRKLRWKRDTILSQSMRIGPATSGKSSGMKLTGIDKGESAREDREVADVVRLWRAQAGRLRSVISGAGITQPIPDIGETLPVRLAQQSEGAISAPKPCVLCALKRNERVHKVDFEVQDSFGEFWTEHWGHTLCMEFWYTYETNLAAR